MILLSVFFQEIFIIFLRIHMIIKTLPMHFLIGEQWHLKKPILLLLSVMNKNQEDSM